MYNFLFEKKIKTETRAGVFVNNLSISRKKFNNVIHLILGWQIKLIAQMPELLPRPIFTKEDMTIFMKDTVKCTK